MMKQWINHHLWVFFILMVCMPVMVACNSYDEEEKNIPLSEKALLGTWEPQKLTAKVIIPDTNTPVIYEVIKTNGKVEYTLNGVKVPVEQLDFLPEYFDFPRIEFIDGGKYNYYVYQKNQWLKYNSGTYTLDTKAQTITVIDESYPETATISKLTSNKMVLKGIFSDKLDKMFADVVFTFIRVK